jgi:hypothetical protein
MKNLLYMLFVLKSISSYLFENGEHNFIFFDSFSSGWREIIIATFCAADKPDDIIKTLFHSLFSYISKFCVIINIILFPVQSISVTDLHR